MKKQQYTRMTAAQHGCYYHHGRMDYRAGNQLPVCLLPEKSKIEWEAGWLAERKRFHVKHPNLSSRRNEMKKQYYTIHAFDKQGSRYTYQVLASSHMQHYWACTELMNVSKAGAEKIEKLRQQGYSQTVEIGGRNTQLANG